MRACRVLRRFSEAKIDSNLSMIRRELYADVLQNSIKYAAYTFSGSQAVKAELMRALIDALNHLIMLSANSHSQQVPDENYNYGELYIGYKKIKNMAVLMPGVCFGISGLYNILSPLMTLWTGIDIPALTLNTTSLSLIFLSSFGEYYLYYKNLGDISSDRGLPFYKRIIERSKLSYNVCLKRKTIDPIQDAIITENVLALAGVSFPIVTSFLCHFTGLHWIDLVGEISNGFIQVYLGAMICKVNIEILSGRSIGSKDTMEIVKILKDRDEIADIAEFKTEYIGNDSVKISASIKYNSLEVAKNIIEVFEKDIQKISSDPAKQEEVRQLLIKSTDLLFTHTTEIIRNMEEDVREVYPNATEIDLEMAKSNIKREYQGMVSLSSDDDEVGQNNEGKIDKKIGNTGL